MWTIRQGQVDAFKQVATNNFESRMVEHIAKFFPKQLVALGEQTARQTIQYGIQRAEAYGIVAERDVCKYVDLVFLFGRDFDKEYVWAQNALTDEEVPEPAVRIGDLYELAKSLEKD
jgi:hypothetical protein